ncbi:MAG: undecaprenyl pyrophosphate phosphatase, partial [Actinomycetia bacterium]|nr:undecaprenyl pyrophosphate phosphatase [Actinomycetes bacterium]
MSHLSYLEAIVVGAFQGVSELFPISSLGHSILIPALIGGQWAKDLNVSAADSPYLAFIVGLHVATAVALVIFFWREWLRIIGGLFSSLRDRRIQTPDQKLGWMLVIATVPVGLVGVVADHAVRTLLGKPVPAALFLAANGFVLYAGELLKRHVAARHEPPEEPGIEPSVASDRRLARLGWGEGIAIGSAQILALLPGISRSGSTIVVGLTRGLSHEDAARFSFLLATPVILAAGVLKIPELLKPANSGIMGPVLVGSVVSGIGAYLATRFLVKYFETRSLTPFAIYCTVFGLASAVYLGV